MYCITYKPASEQKMKPFLFLNGGHLGISLREIMFLFSPLFFSLPSLTLFQFLIGFLKKIKKIG